MLGTCATGELHFPPQSRSSAVQANAGTPSTDAAILGDRPDGPALQIYEPDKLCIVRMDERQQPLDADADVALPFGILSYLEEVGVNL